MLLWAGRVYDFLRVLEEIVGFLPARRQSYVVGYRSGSDGAAVSRQFFQAASPGEARSRLFLEGSRILAGAGWGRCAIEYDDTETGVRWEFPEGTAIGLAAKLEGIRENPACPFIAGFVAGAGPDAIVACLVEPDSNVGYAIMAIQDVGRNVMRVLEDL